MSFLLHRQGVMARAVHPSAPGPLVFTDDFTRPNEALDASGDWILPVDGSVMSIVNSRAQSTGTDNTGFAQAVRDVGFDRYVEMTVRCLTAADSRNADLILRMAGNGSSGHPRGYIFRTRRNGNWQMGLREAIGEATPFPLSGSRSTLGETYTARLEVRGHVLTGYLNGVLVGELTISGPLFLDGGSGFQVQPPGTNRPAQTVTRFETGSL